MEKRLLLAFVLSFAVLVGFNILFPRQTPTPSAPPAASTPTSASQPAETNPPPATAVAPLPGDVPAEDIQAANEEVVVVDTDLYTAMVSNVGGVVKSFKLKKYPDDKGHAIELINSIMGEKAGWPLAISTDDEKLTQELAQAKFVVKRNGLQLAMDFSGDNVVAHKTLEFDPEKYQFNLATAVTRNGMAVPHRVVWQSSFGDQSKADDPKKKLAIYDSNSKFTQVAVGSIKDVQKVTTARVGVEDQYFLAMLISPQEGPAWISKTDVQVADGKTLSAPRVEAAVTAPIHVYVGPKDANWLAKTDPRLEAVINYGWFEVISKPLLFALLWIHHYIGNFGWAIIILTCALNLVLFPLRLKSQVSMQKMQKIQPQLKTLMDKQKKLKATDPRRAEVQKEIMDLYNAHGVNPMGGCLPMLLQMPLLIAFYSMLSASIELRGAHWLWIHDLSQYDPTYVIPIVMAILMVVQQKMTPTTVDPAQARTMMLMPVMMTAIFLWAQAGLTLYWLTSTLVGIGQQWFIKRYWSAPIEAPAPRLIKNKQSRG